MFVHSDTVDGSDMPNNHKYQPFGCIKPRKEWDSEITLTVGAVTKTLLFRLVRGFYYQVPSYFVYISLYYFA